jgi:hemolysin activation/secretion protein
MAIHMRITLCLTVAGLLVGTVGNAQRISPQLWKEWEDREIELERLDPPLDPPPEFWTATTIRGLVFVESLDLVNPAGAAGIGVTVQGLEVLDTESFRRRMWPFLGQNLNYDTMRAIQAEALAYLRDHYRPLVDIIYPEQEVTDGILQIVVREARVGKFELREPGAQEAGLTNRWADVNYLGRMIRLRSGSVVDTLTLEEDLDWVTRSPYRDIAGQVTFRKGAGPQEADVYASIRHRKPWEVFVGYDNTGSEATDLNRIFAGVAGGATM